MTLILLAIVCFAMPGEMRGMQEASDSQKPCFSQVCVINNGEVISNDKHPLQCAVHYVFQQVPTCSCTQSGFDIHAWLKSHALTSGDDVFSDLNKQLFQSRCIHKRGRPTSLGIIELTAECVCVRWCGDLKVTILNQNCFGSFIPESEYESDASEGSNSDQEDSGPTDETQEFNRLIGCMPAMLDDECVSALECELVPNLSAHKPLSWEHVIFTNQLFHDNKSVGKILSLSKETFDEEEAKQVVYRLHAIARNLAHNDPRVSLTSVSYKLMQTSQEK